MIASTIRTLISLVSVLILTLIVAIAVGLATAAVAHYRLGWEADRVNGLGNMVILATWSTLAWNFGKDVVKVWRK